MDKPVCSSWLVMPQCYFTKVKREMKADRPTLISEHLTSLAFQEGHSFWVCVVCLSDFELGGLTEIDFWRIFCRSCCVYMTAVQGSCLACLELIWGPWKAFPRLQVWIAWLVLPTWTTWLLSDNDDSRNMLASVVLWLSKERSTLCGCHIWISAHTYFLWIHILSAWKWRHNLQCIGSCLQYRCVLWNKVMLLKPPRHVAKHIISQKFMQIYNILTETVSVSQSLQGSHCGYMTLPSRLFVVSDS